MVEEVFTKTEEIDFTEVWRTTWETPYILRLVLSAGIGGLLFGYDTGVISGALLYIKEEFNEVDNKRWLQEMIVSMTVAGAIVGAAIGGWYNDKFGRKMSILVADVLFFVGAIVMAIAPSPHVIILGRLLVGFGVGMASITSPLYISEMSPARIRGALVSTNGLLITGGQFLSYLINLWFAHSICTCPWRWMLGVSAIPAIIQFCLMLSLPESPRWLYRNERMAESRDILERIYPAEKVEAEIVSLKKSVQAEKADEDIIGHTFTAKLKGALSNPVVRHGLAAGVTVQIAQQFVGINTVMYYSPTILQFAGYASKKTAMALALITSGLNAVGSIVSMMFVDRYGRRKLMIISMFGIISCLISLAVVFSQASYNAPKIDMVDSITFARNATCQAYVPYTASHVPKWNCMRCLKSDCGFCSNGAHEHGPGACVVESTNMRTLCRSKGRTYFKNGCPSKFGYLAIVFLGLYIIVYAPGMGTVPWIVNSEIYPLRYRGIGGGIAAVANWMSNLIVSETFLTLTHAVGSSGTFLLFAGSSAIGLFFIWLLVPETKGLPFEQVEKMLETGYKPSLFRTRTDAEQAHTTSSQTTRLAIIL